MKAKQDIRRDIAAERAALDPQWLESASARVVENVQALAAFKAAKTVALYMAMDGEVNLDALLPRCWELGKRTCIPVFNHTTKLYEMAEITPNTAYHTGHYGIREPDSPAPVTMDTIELIAVPGVAFDRNGNRLGRGGGYYDRLLEGFLGHTVAVAFDFQILPRIPTDGHDRPMHCIVTETRFFNI